MIPGDPNVRSVELVVAALGDLRNQLVLVGGCAASLLIDAPTVTPPRITYDVDLIAEVAVLGDYHALERKFLERGFARNAEPDAPICRWTLGAIKVDLMPTGETVLGFTNRWYAEAVASAARLRLPSGAEVRLISAPAFLATKFEAFVCRGQSDFIASHDFEDIVNVVEGRLSIVEEIDASAMALRNYLTIRFKETLLSVDFENVLPGLVTHDELHGQRVQAVRQRIAAIAALAFKRLP